MPTNSTNADDPIVQRLRALVKESPDLNGSAQLYIAVLPLLRDADLHVGTISLTPDQVLQKMGAGLPLLHDLDLELDIEAVRALMIKLAAAVEEGGGKHQPHKPRLPWLKISSEPDTAARRIRLALEENKLEVGALLPQVAAGDTDAVASAIKERELDPGLFMTLAQNALKPALRAWRKQLTPLAEGFPWHKGACFICGAAATLGELQENDQVKHLRCGSCGADWRFSRLQCMYCGNEDHKTLRYLYAEDRREKMRVEVCDKCRGYLKVISSFLPTPPEMLPVEDLATLFLDFVAQERGYGRVSAR